VIAQPDVFVGAAPFFAQEIAAAAGRGAITERGGSDIERRDILEYTYISRRSAPPSQRNKRGRFRENFKSAHHRSRQRVFLA
jgi:hypothetical protein